MRQIRQQREQKQKKWKQTEKETPRNTCRHPTNLHPKNPFTINLKHLP